MRVWIGPCLQCIVLMDRPRKHICLMRFLNGVLILMFKQLFSQRACKKLVRMNTPVQIMVLHSLDIFFFY
jgi:hypothetical protein